MGTHLFVSLVVISVYNGCRLTFAIKQTLRGLFILQSDHHLINSHESRWYVYILRCADNSLYTGVTKDYERRLAEHNLDSKKAAKYTRARRPVVMVYVELASNRSNACQREASIKRLTSAQEESLVSAFAHDTHNSSLALHASIAAIA